MGQWGAYGYAKHGLSHKQIVLHYFKGTQIGRSAAPTIRVLLLAGVGRVTFGHAVQACGVKLKAASRYRAERTGSSVILKRSNGSRLASCGAKLRAKGDGGLVVSGKGTYRDGLEVTPAAGSGVNAVNAVDLEDYVRGVVPNEVPSSWPVAALRAQAVAARSYVLATRRGGASDVYDDTRSQVYRGRGSETTRTNQATAATKGQVVRYAGKVATTFFFSSSGGRTEDIRYAMPGAQPQPYLKSVRDAYDSAAPLHGWTRRISDSRMQAALGDLVPGTLKGIEVTQTGVSPRIVRARLVGSSGNATVAGTTLRSRLGLPSTWARFSQG
jgi:stage II sporulation protein D